MVYIIIIMNPDWLECMEAIYARVFNAPINCPCAVL